MQSISSHLLSENTGEKRKAIVDIFVVKFSFLTRVVMEARGERQLCGEASCVNPDTNASFLLGEDCTVIC